MLIVIGREENSINRSVSRKICEAFRSTSFRARRLGASWAGGPASSQASTITHASNPTSCSYALNKAIESSGQQSCGGYLDLVAGAGCPLTAASDAGRLVVPDSDRHCSISVVNRRKAPARQKPHKRWVLFEGLILQLSPDRRLLFGGFLSELHFS
jgi:hypothetical protein